MTSQDLLYEICFILDATVVVNLETLQILVKQLNGAANNSYRIVWYSLTAVLHVHVYNKHFHVVVTPTVQLLAC